MENAFQITYHDQLLNLKELSIGATTIFIIQFPEGALMKITKAKVPGGDTKWVSIGEDRHKEAAAIGKLIEIHFINKVD
jgi:hypothetical protein